MNVNQNQPAEQEDVLRNIDATFYDDIVEKTRRYLGAGSKNNEFQPESIVQSVLRSAMVKGKIEERSIEDMEQLRAFLIFKARRKIWDRRRKNRPASMSSVTHDDDRAGPDAMHASSEPQPHDIAGDDEQSEQRIRSVASMFARLREELSAEDWTIVKLRILNDQPWSTVAAIIGRTPGAARKHYTTRLKPKLSEVLSGIEIDD